MRVICVKWGDKYGPEWVYNLRNMVQRHLTIEHEFVCITDNPIDDVDCVPCADGLPTWWAKIAMFEPDKFPGHNLYLDLDVVITDNIDGLVNYFHDHLRKCIETGMHSKVLARDDFSYSLVNPKQGLGADMKRYLGGAGTVNSSVMLWRDNAGRDVWDKFKPEKMQEVHGDQNWVTQALWPDRLELLPNKWVCSYKYHVLRGEKVAPVIVFHGNPKVTDLSQRDPLRLAWAS